MLGLRLSCHEGRYLGSESLSSAYSQRHSNCIDSTGSFELTNIVYNICATNMADHLEHHFSHQQQDENTLAEIGYKQELNRDWSLLHNFGISFSIIVGQHHAP